MPRLDVTQAVGGFRINGVPCTGLTSYLSKNCFVPRSIGATSHCRMLDGRIHRRSLQEGLAMGRRVDRELRDPSTPLGRLLRSEFAKRGWSLVGFQTLVAYPKRRVATQIDILARDSKHCLVAIEVKHGFHGIWDVHDKRMRRVGKYFTNSPQHEALLQACMGAAAYEATYGEQAQACVVRHTDQGTLTFEAVRPACFVRNVARRV